MPTGTSTLRGITWAAVASLLSACFVLPWAVASRQGDASAAVFMLLTSAAIFSTASLPLARTSARALARPRSARETWLALQLATLTLGGNWASAKAVSELSPALFAVVLRSEVLLVAVLAFALMRERIEASFWPGVALAGLGLWIVHGGGSLVAGGTAGALWGFAAATAFGTMTVLTRRRIHEIDPLRVNMLRLWMSVGLWVPLNLATASLAEFTPALVGYAVLAALCGPVGARLCLMYSTRHVEARITAMIALSAPVLTLGAAWILLGEWPSANELGGGAVMLLGIAIPLTGWIRAQELEGETT